MMAHTPGPWTNDNGLVNGKESRERFAPGVSVDIFDASEWPAELYDEAHANACLIATAPEMLVALKEARDFIQAERNVRFDSCSLGGRVDTLDADGAELVSEADARLAQIDAAIAKAEGRAP